MLKAASYIRKSTNTDGHMNEKQKNSLNVQRGVVIQYASGHFDLVKEFSDKESGRKITRNGLQAALKWLRADKTRVLITKSDRIARTLDIIPEIRDILPQLRFIDIQAPNEPIDEFRLQLSIMLAERESATLGMRVKAAYAFLQAKGMAEGWGKDKDELEQMRMRSHESSRARANDYALNLLKALNDLEKAGYTTLQDKVARLNEMGFKSARGKTLTAPGVSRTITRARNNGLTG